MGAGFTTCPFFVLTFAKTLFTRSEERVDKLVPIAIGIGVSLR
jgi:hypothetical protein